MLYGLVVLTELRNSASLARRVAPAKPLLGALEHCRPGEQHDLLYHALRAA